MNKENKIATLTVDNGGGLRIGNSVVTNVGIGNSIVFALDAYPCVSKYNLRLITNEEFKNLDWIKDDTYAVKSYLWLSKHVETFKYRFGFKAVIDTDEKVSDYKDCPIGEQVTSGIAYDIIVNNGNYIELFGMAAPDYILKNMKLENYIYFFYEYVIDGKVYRFELRS